MLSVCLAVQGSSKLVEEGTEITLPKGFPPHIADVPDINTILKVNYLSLSLSLFLSLSVSQRSLYCLGYILRLWPVLLHLFIIFLSRSPSIL